MAGDELRVTLEIQPGFLLQHAHNRERHRHQRRLRIFGEGEHIGRALEHDGAELGAERLVDLGKDLARGREIRRQRLAHADRLTALARKYESDRHTLPCPFTARRASLFCARGPFLCSRRVEIGPKDTAIRGYVKLGACR